MAGMRFPTRYERWLQIQRLEAGMAAQPEWKVSLITLALATAIALLRTLGGTFLSVSAHVGLLGQPSRPRQRHLSTPWYEPSRPGQRQGDTPDQFRLLAPGRSQRFLHRSRMAVPRRACNSVAGSCSTSGCTSSAGLPAMRASNTNCALGP